jgi:hypothetical protein
MNREVDILRSLLLVGLYQNIEKTGSWIGKRGWKSARFLPGALSP